MLHLDVIDNDSIVDAANNPLGGAEVGSGNYAKGESYLVRLYGIYLPGVRR